MPLSFFSRKPPVNKSASNKAAANKVAANKAAANKAAANKAVAKKDAGRNATAATLKKLSTNAKYRVILNKLTLTDPVKKKSRRLRKLKEKAAFAKSNLSAKIADLKRLKATQKDVEHAQQEYESAYQNLANFEDANEFAESNESPTKANPFTKPFSELMRERNEAYSASKGANVGKILDLSKHIKLSEDNQRMLNEATNDDLEIERNPYDSDGDELERAVRELPNNPIESGLTRKLAPRIPRLVKNRNSLKALPLKGRRRIRFSPPFTIKSGLTRKYAPRIPRIVSSRKLKDLHLKGALKSGLTRKYAPRIPSGAKSSRKLKAFPWKGRGRKQFTPVFIENYQSRRRPIVKPSEIDYREQLINQPIIEPNLFNAYKEYTGAVREYNKPSEIDYRELINQPINDPNLFNAYKEYTGAVREYNKPGKYTPSLSTGASLGASPRASLGASTGASLGASPVPFKVDNLQERARLQLAMEKYKQAKLKGPYLNEHEDMLVAWIHHLSKR